MIEQVAATMAIASGEKTREQITKEITEKYKKRR